MSDLHDQRTDKNNEAGKAKSGGDQQGKFIYEIKNALVVLSTRVALKISDYNGKQISPFFASFNASFILKTSKKA